jgi:hypothetical protein
MSCRSFCAHTTAFQPLRNHQVDVRTFVWYNDACVTCPRQVRKPGNPGSVGQVMREVKKIEKPGNILGSRRIRLAA